MAVKILVVNCGSSTIKLVLYDQKEFTSLFEAEVSWESSFQTVVLKIKNQKEKSLKLKSSEEAMLHLLEILPVKNLDEISIIGHRIVHGGLALQKPLCIDEKVKETLQTLCPLAPLHLPLQIAAISLLEKKCPKAKMVAVFDTAFHRTMKPSASYYAGPLRWAQEGIIRFGFHGISFQYCTKLVAEILKKDVMKLKMVICHLGSGASLCAVDGGKSIDTTMGFTPLDGLMMDTRTGTFDPAILLYLMREKKRGPDELFEEIYQKSGLLGISGSTSDMKEIIEKMQKKDEKALLAFEMYIHRLNAYIGSMIASLQGIDVLVFTAGIGENAVLLRKKVCENFAFLGIEIDEDTHTGNRVISKKKSKVDVLVVHTDESLEIARQAWKVCNP